MSNLHPLTWLTWLGWGFFMSLGWCLGCALWAWASSWVAKLQLPAKSKWPRYEHMTITVSPSDGHDFTLSRCNELGEAGWKLAFIDGKTIWFIRSLP